MVVFATRDTFGASLVLDVDFRRRLRRNLASGVVLKEFRKCLIDVWCHKKDLKSQ